MLNKRAQLPTEEANASRAVTKLRWILGAVHGIGAQRYCDELDSSRCIDAEKTPLCRNIRLQPSFWRWLVEAGRVCVFTVARPSGNRSAERGIHGE